eukprot:gnl/Spiro4/21370_TR10443_c0_g1_i1.p1 gnl/Spiro4/21370_TR10443_c0_g1~~gnl/Spiro4/21370_TR10443_c0_g1_i1.p1  ORF type:complete len:507 (+),score=-46.44 gnl/Spiro4/21370_TR10443_c0_g1_i1:473-1993(+)
MYRTTFSDKFNVASTIAISNILAFSRGISMTFTLQDLKHLEIMAELEGKPASPSEESTVVEAAYTPTTLTEKLLTLASKLRTAGFIHQAESLESTFGMYKKAEQDVNLLYRAHSETGDDLLESAHPDGDVEMAPAQDHNGDVETLPSKHKKIIEVVQKSASDDVDSKSAILDMLKLTLNIKSAQVNGGDPAARKKSFDEFTSIVNEILSTFEAPLSNLFGNTKYEVMLDSGKPMVKWKEEINLSMDRLKNSISQYNSYVQNNTVNDKSAALMWPKDFLEKVNALAKDMQTSINTEKNFKIQDPSSKEKGLDNVKFPNVLKSKVAALQHLWYTFWAKYGEGKKEDLEYHSKFLTPTRIIQIFTPEKTKLESIKSYILRQFSQSNEVKSTPAIMAYINSMVAFIEGMEKNFQTIIDKAQVFVNGDQGAFGTTEEMTMETIKGFITDKTLLSKANFGSPLEFSTSLNDICKTLISRLHSLVDSNEVFNKNKEEIKTSLNDRSAALFGPK